MRLVDFFRKIHLSLILWELFKVTAPSRTVIGNYCRYLIANCAVRRTELRLCLWFYIARGLASARWKNMESIDNGGRNSFWLLCFIFHLENPLWMLRALVNFSKTVLPALDRAGNGTSYLLQIFQFKLNLVAHYLRSVFLTKVPFLPLPASFLVFVLSM
jgi:hypothetical protein